MQLTLAQQSQMLMELANDTQSVVDDEATLNGIAQIAQIGEEVTQFQILRNATDGTPTNITVTPPGQAVVVVKSQTDGGLLMKAVLDAAKAHVETRLVARKSDLATRRSEILNATIIG